MDNKEMKEETYLAIMTRPNDSLTLNTALAAFSSGRQWFGLSSNNVP